jgi:hypothetical protein
MASQVLTGIAKRQGSTGFPAGTAIEAALLEGTIGQATTTEFVAFLRLFRQLPSVPEILLNPDRAPVPEEPSARIAVATALGRVLTDHSIAKGMVYLNRLPTEMRVLSMRVMSQALSYSSMAAAMRSWLFGVLLSESAERTPDAELLAVATILHDLGLTDRYTAENRFEVDGAPMRRARF